MQAQMMSVRLSRDGAPNWGFRLQGGKDFGTPLVIQKVNGGSPAERAGLLAGDSVIKINNVEVFNLRHKDAQDVIVQAGPHFEITVQRGGSTWRPSVTPVGNYPQSSPSINNVAPVTKTSLAAKNQSNVGAIGTGHNLAAKPFNSCNGTSNGVSGPKLVNKQYNTPVGLYSEESIAETISAQTEVLSGGCLGVNFKKNEKNYDSSNSAVFRMLQESEHDHDEPEPDSGIVTSPNRGVAGLRHVAAPENKPQPPKPQLPPGQNICADCERLIVGVFVRIKDKNLHVECFKCATCGTSLKNVGYYNINNKLYCDIHAKLAAKNNAPGPNLVPVAVPPGGRIPSGTISAALSSHALPTQSPLSPTSNPISPPFSLLQPDSKLLAINAKNLLESLAAAAASKQKTEPANNDSGTDLNNSTNDNNSTQSFKTNYPLLLKPSANLSGPRPFASVNAPLSPPYKPVGAPLSPISSVPAPEKGRYVNIVWPPIPDQPDIPTACPLYFPPPSVVNPINPKLEQELSIEDHEEMETIAQSVGPKMSICSTEVCNINGRRSTLECLETISESLQTKIFVDGIVKERPKSPPPVEQDVVITTKQEEKPKIVQEEGNLEENVLNKQSSELLRPTDIQRAMKAMKGLENAVPRKWESPMMQALTTMPSDPFLQIPSKQSRSRSAFVSALSIAPSEPFTPLLTTLDPVPLPEETEPYFPPEHPIVAVEKKEPKEEPPNETLFVKALQTAPERPFTPVAVPKQVKKKKPSDPFLSDLPKPQEHLTMRTALTTASDRSYTPLICETFSVKLETETGKQEETKEPVKQAPRAVVNTQPGPKPFKPVVIDSFRPCEEKERPPSTSFPPVTDELKTAYEYHADYSQIKSELSTQIMEQSSLKEVHVENGISHHQHEQEPEQLKQQVVANTNCQNCKCSMKSEEEAKKSLVVVEKQSECTVMKKPMNLIGCLHKPEGLPHYQLALDTAPIAMDFVHSKKPGYGNQINQQTSNSNQDENHYNTTKPPSSIASTSSEYHHSSMFKPVSDDRPSSSSFSPRPGSVTPSMINKPAPKIPYYQANLVATEFLAPEVNLFDPKSPAVSRSPSPCPGGARSLSPFRPPTPRPKSPAQGPPPNPLKNPHALEALKESKEMKHAKESLLAYIPQHKERLEQTYAAQVSCQNRNYPQQEDACHLQKVKESEHLQRLHLDKSELEQRKTALQNVAGGVLMMDISEKSQMQHLEQQNCSKTESVERSADNSVQIQRRKMVTEEYEHTHKEKTVQIQKELKSYPFQNTKDPFSEAAVHQPHVACPQPLAKQNFLTGGKTVLPNQGIVGMTVTCPQPLASPFLSGNQKRNSVPQQQELQNQCPNIQVDSCSTLSKPDSKPECFQHVNQCPNTDQQCPSNVKQCTNVNQQCPASKVNQQCPSSSGNQCPKTNQDCPTSKVNQQFKSYQKANGAASSCARVTPSMSSTRQSTSRPNVPVPNTGSGGGRQAGAIGVAPRRGRGVLNVGGMVGSRIPTCGQCHQHIRGPFITALGKIWCPDHFVCSTPSCRRPLQDLGFVEEHGQLYCEYCFEQYLAPPCSRCNQKIKGDCLKAIGKNYHPECFNCTYCGKLFGNAPFFLEEGSPYCENDWNELFTTKCFACGFPVEAGDRWVEALNNNYHSQCFNCTMCKKNLEGQSFFAKGGRPFCKNHAR